MTESGLPRDRWVIHGYGLSLYPTTERYRVELFQWANFNGELVRTERRVVGRGFASPETAAKWTERYVKANPGHLSYEQAQAAQETHMGERGAVPA